MHFKIDDLISYCSQYISLTEGDLILTGTPEGVGAIKVGDSIEGTASFEGKVLASLKFKVT
jgi:2-keto-4-pentenoate hydratase/2-oxohepta-3-ene-1,7-dioic acid hydratase in catechol pathway